MFFHRDIGSMTQVRNPFFNRHRITDPAYFFGRQRELERLYSAIATHQCVSLVGERKMGKSSLLTRLSHAETLKSFGFEPELYLFVYFDLEGLASARRDDFWLELLDTIAAQLPPGDMAQAIRKQTDGGDVRFLTARRALRRLRDTGLEVVLMLDEFESLARNAQFEPDFYGELRSLAGELGLVILTASKRSLYDLTYENSSTLSSPFFNIFSEMPVGLMTEDDARKILIELSSRSGTPFCAEEVDWALDLAGPHPFFTQVIGSHLFELPGAGQLRSSEVYEVVRKRFTAEAEDHYRYTWASLDSTEQSGLLSLTRASEGMLKTLRAKSLVREIDGRPAPFSDAFAAFLERERRKAQSISGGEHSTTVRDLTGKTLGPYRVLEPLGRGGMAEVYKGYHSMLDRYVAIKVLLAHLINDGAFVERFQREAAAVARLRHTNIVQVHDFGIYEDIPYMVMEFIPGVTLKERLTTLRLQGDRMPVKDVLAFTWELASALDHAHANGLVHRDVKPANILLREAAPTHCEAILTDFGIAKILEGVQFTETGLSMGTPDYMSPEQAAGDTITPQTDVYALGIVVFEMLTGQLPFRADTPAAVLLKHLNTDPPSPRTIDPSVPVALDAVLFRALAKRAHDRWHSAGEFATALELVLTPGAVDQATLEYER
jgi:tRNA A-37 threonylcarbamoyl transferase component Bud32